MHSEENFKEKAAKVQPELWHISITLMHKYINIRTQLTSDPLLVIFKMTFWGKCTILKNKQNHHLRSCFFYSFFVDIM